MRPAILLATVLLAACGSETADGPQNIAAGGAGSGLTVSAGTADCAQKPEFVPVYDDATISVCVANDTGTGKIAGNLQYEVSASPERIIVWSKDQAVKAGLKPMIQSETTLTAEDGDRRTLAIVVSADESGSQVLANWSVRK